MSEESNHWSLQVEAVKLWGSGQLVEARKKFEAAIAAARPDEQRRSLTSELAYLLNPGA